MNVTQMQYASAKETLEEVQRLPVESRRVILTMLRGAIVISDMYVQNQPGQTPTAKRPGA